MRGGLQLANEKAFPFSAWIDYLVGSSCDWGLCHSDGSRFGQRESEIMSRDEQDTSMLIFSLLWVVQSVCKGRFAEKHVPLHVRNIIGELISAESLPPLS